MKIKFISMILTGTLIIGVLSGCGNSSQQNMEANTLLAENTMKTDAQDAKIAGKANIYYKMGCVYLYGLDEQEIDFEAAYTNFENALELGKTEANFYLGLLYDWYGYPKQDFKKAKAYYEAAGDDPRAQLSLGILYYNGQGVEEDPARAKELVEAAIAKDYVEGYLGSGVVARAEEDYDTALKYYNKVLEGEEQIYIANAMNDIGSMYRYGQGVEKDCAQAMEWYGKAADLGYFYAMNSIGNMYYYGEGVNQDYSQAMEWYGKAADLGYVTAMHNIGYMYRYGEGVEQDYAQAMEWYEKAADLNYAAAMNAIGMLYYRGEGVENDSAKAMEWYEKAANLGNSDAMYNIAQIYHYGDGVEEDLDKAQEWYDKAAAAQ